MPVELIQPEFITDSMLLKNWISGNNKGPRVGSEFGLGVLIAVKIKGRRNPRVTYTECVTFPACDWCEGKARCPRFNKKSRVR